MKANWYDSASGGSMELLIVRHGNTFAGGEKVVWVGCGEDPPLTGEGVEQGLRLGRALAASGVEPGAIYCGPLRRTRQFAEILAAELPSAGRPIIDERLKEIDYGRWAGLTNDEIAERYGDRDLLAWSRESRWPPAGVWGSSEADVRGGILRFAEEIRSRHEHGGAVIAVSSNGCIRYFLTVVPGEFERRAAQGALKVRTGAVCKLSSSGRVFTVSYWNRSPDELRSEDE